MKSPRNLCSLLAIATPFLLSDPVQGQEQTDFMGRDPEIHELIEDLKPDRKAITRGIRLGPEADPSATAGDPAASGLKSVVLDIKFEFDSADLTPEAQELLKRLGQALSSRDVQGYRFLIEGHTDSLGPSAYYLQLSESRAQVLHGFLQGRFGLPLENLEVRELGETRPLDPNHPRARINRRVEIINLGEAAVPR